eukprot:SM000032S12083  [mRNA]  locus=s32:451908:454230:+ [translate_table: standard]
MARAKDAYLAAYNAAQALGWGAALTLVLGAVVRTGGWRSGYSAAGQLVSICQLAAVLEVVHAATGLVRSSAQTAFLQWFGRTHVLLAVIASVPEVQQLQSVTVMLLAWALSEVIRYPQYCLNILGSCPGWLTWLRYSAFIPLYPLGLFWGENQQTHSAFFSLLPFDYRTFLVVLLAVYPAIWWQLYTHMFKQRRVKLGRSEGHKRE